jgi:hypothetical protein
MGVGCGVWSWAIIGVGVIDGGKGPLCAYWQGLGKCKVGALCLHKGLGVGSGNW